MISHEGCRQLCSTRLYQESQEGTQREIGKRGAGVTKNNKKHLSALLLLAHMGGQLPERLTRRLTGSHGEDRRRMISVMNTSWHHWLRAKTLKAPCCPICIFHPAQQLCMTSTPPPKKKNLLIFQTNAYLTLCSQPTAPTLCCWLSVLQVPPEVFSSFTYSFFILYIV